MSQAAQEGTSMSSVMELYPDLYPAHVVALTHSGEVGGFLPDACDTIAQQAQKAHKFRRWFVWIWFVVFNAALSIPLVYVITRAALSTWDAVEARGGDVTQSQSLGILGNSAWHWLLWPIGPITLTVYALCYLLWRLYFARRSTRFRDGVALNWPVFGARARAENLTMFSWTMSRLAQAGLPHSQAWDLAARSAPNEVMSARLQGLGSSVGRDQPASAAMQRSNLFPPEFGTVIGTAELTGDVPGAYNQLAEMSRGEFESAENLAKIRGGCWGALGCFLSCAFVLAVFLRFYGELLAKVVKTEP
jgi:type II secretory pathway component PulF